MAVFSGLLSPPATEAAFMSSHITSVRQALLVIRLFRIQNNDKTVDGRAVLVIILTGQQRTTTDDCCSLILRPKTIHPPA